MASTALDPKPGRNRRRTWGFAAAWQGAVVLTVVLLFWVLASLSTETGTPELWPWAIGGGFSALLWLSTLGITIRGLWGSPFNLRNLIRDNPQLWIAAVYLALALRDVNVIPMCDSGAYFRMILEAVQRFDFSPGHSLQAMALAGHPAQAYAAYMMMGQFLRFAQYSVANLQMSLLHVAGIFAFSGITGQLFPGPERKWERWLATLLFAFTPLVYGMSLTVSPDFAVLAFMCLVIWAALRSYHLLAVACGIMLCFSKEAGALLYAGLVLGVFGVMAPHDACRGRAPWYQGLIPEWKRHVHLLLPLVLYAFYLAQGAPVWRFGSAQDAVSAVDVFAPDPWLLWDKTVQIFLANFNWLVWGLTAMSLPLALLWGRRKAIQQNGLSSRGTWFAVLTVTMIPFLLVNYFFVTWSNARYILPMALVAVLFLVRALESWVKPSQVRAGCLAFLVVPFAASCFRTFDPALMQAFSTFTLGEHRMSFYNSSPTICDLTFYNREYVYYNRLFDRFLVEVGYDPQTDELVFFTGGRWADLARHNIEYLWTGGRLLGPMYVDTGTLKRSFIAAGNPRLRSMIFVSGEAAPSFLPGHAYSIQLFWKTELRDLSASQMNAFYRVVREIHVEEDGYSLVGYELALRD